MGERLKDKAAIVTGAGSAGPGWGNGEAAAVLCAREGARVFLVDRDAVALAESVTADVTRSNEVENMVAACVNVFGGVDVLRNNVGTVVVGGPVEISQENWSRLLEVNVKSKFLTCKYA
jgi:NAD(P)-dependent dehydrogenase (short-subunit alcohol dehydrogenase family)